MKIFSILFSLLISMSLLELSLATVHERILLKLPAGFFPTSTKHKLLTLQNLDQEKFPEIVRHLVIPDYSGQTSLDQGLEEIQKKFNICSEPEKYEVLSEGLSPRNYQEKTIALICNSYMGEEVNNFSYYLIKLIRGNSVGKNSQGISSNHVQFYLVLITSKGIPLSEEWEDRLLDIDLCDPKSKNPKNFCE